MSTYIAINRFNEQGNIIYYKVWTISFGGAEFYVGIDREKELLHFYLTDDFSLPARTITRGENEKIGRLNGIDEIIFAKVVVKTMSALYRKNFPDYL